MHCLGCSKRLLRLARRPHQCVEYRAVQGDCICAVSAVVGVSEEDGPLCDGDETNSSSSTGSSREMNALLA
jgi:hypothetical protein